MTENPKVVIRDGQLISSGDLYADYGDEEVIVAFGDEAVEHPALADLPDNEMGQRVQSSREAMYLASAAATIAKERGNVDDDDRILVEVQDIEAAAE